MVKVTGGGTRRGAVAAHFAYSQPRRNPGDRDRRGRAHWTPGWQKRLIDDWHLELTAGQYREQMDGGPV